METEIILVVDGKSEKFNLFINDYQDITDLLWEVRIALRSKLSKEKK